MQDLKQIFKAYDIRGIYPEQINEEVVCRIAQSFAVFTKAKKVAVGRDVRVSSLSLQRQVIEGLTSLGVEVIDIGLVPTEMLYFAVGSLDLDGGIQVSASHNPRQFNGLKMIRKNVEAISSDNGLNEIRDLALSDQVFSSEDAQTGSLSEADLSPEFITFLSKFAKFNRQKPLRIVLNNNFGVNGPLFERILTSLSVNDFELIKLNFEPDGTFPKGRPDPLVPENRQETSQRVIEQKADLAISWDADGDRCYITDEKGVFIEGCHLTAILAEQLLKSEPGSKIIYDPRNVWAVEETVNRSGGVAIKNKAGHTFIKNRMKQEQALFAGEMSGHFYFKDFYFADSGLIPALLFLTMILSADKTVSEFVLPLRERYFVSGEINFAVAQPLLVMAEIEKIFLEGEVDRTDGLSIDNSTWRFNLRPSNTESLLRLNVEARSEQECQEKTDLLVEAIAKLKGA